MTNLLQRFVDFATGEVTADVNNSAVTTESLNGGVTNQNAVEKIYGERIESQSPSGVAAAEFSTGINSDYDRYHIDITDIVPASDGENLRIRLSTDGGQNYKSGSEYSWLTERIFIDGTRSIDAFTSVGEMRLMTAVGSAAGEGGEAAVMLSQPSSGGINQLVRHTGAFINQAGDLTRIIGSARYTTSEAFDAFKVEFSAGNIESGEIDLRGVMA